MRQMAVFFSITKTTTVLDIGGSYKNWSYLFDGPKLTLLNLGPRPENLPTHVQYVRGDARKLPFDDKTFDVVYSNSVIEHVGSKIDQMEMANEMMRVGKGYYCQTPNYWFPVEPHFLAPILHWLPINIRGVFARWFSVWGWVTKTSSEEANEMASTIYLLNKSEMNEMFPDARWMNERVLGVIKSLVAARLGYENKRSK
jgi:ubiquinone/menaquinone biosynthesis C-methylase UbiE